ncbi:MAG: Aminotransferase class IV [Candidatus Moranbacteria bacterium GW2011_GWE1_35_17]|nr:MAG: Aminotransferase class IV [Candidatus Moranbacteria bacterium GW2011_GWE1_35_17]KKP81383.1 MAG: Aminotransferase class IV [Candidatus Moranbacteria bacterium GW2011_GWF1_35_5]
MNKYCYYDGKVVELNEVKISPYDLGFMRGYGIFDAMRTANRALFCFNEHWNKFEKSTRELGLKIPISQEEFKNVVDVLLEKNNLKEAAIKTILTGGKSDNGFYKSEDKETFLILVDDLDKFAVAEEFYKKGWKLISLEYQRYLPEIKSLNYLAPIKNQKEKTNSNAQEIVYKKDGNILECSTSNLFIVKDGIIVTPQKNIFLGTVRNLVIDIAKSNNFILEERNIAIDELLSAEEVFVTATYKKIVPVINVDNVMIGNGKVGDVTNKLIELLNELIKNYA